MTTDLQDERVEELRQRLLVALEALISRRPFSEVNVADVVAEAGTSKRAFYQAFPHRNACLVEHVERFHASWADGIEALVTRDGDRLTGIRPAVEGFLRLIHERPMLARAHLIDAYTIPEGIALRGRVVRRYARIVRQLATGEQGALPVVVDDATALCIVGALEAAAVRVAAEDVEDLRAHVDATVGIVRAMFIGLWVEAEVGPVDLAHLPALDVS